MIMSGAPAEKAGSAGALEETAYEFGATLGVTILGSISALIFRAEVTVDAAFESLRRLDPALAEQVQESLGAAIAIAGELGMPDLAARAGEAFTHSLQVTGYIGGAIMVAVAAVVFLLTPKGTDVANAEH